MTRTWKLAALPLLMLAFAPAPARAQITANIQIGPPQRSWGHDIPIVTYSPERFGPWRHDYRRWQPVTLYYVDGHYYHHRIRGARAVEVYRYHNQYFFPPREPGWNHADRRYNYRHVPNDDDYNRPPRPPQQPGNGRPPQHPPLG